MRAACSCCVESWDCPCKEINVRPLRHTCLKTEDPSAEYRCDACITAKENMPHHHKLLIERHPRGAEKALSVLVWAALWLLGLIAFAYLIGLVS